MDNASIHKAALVQEFVRENGWTIVFLPPYSPEFNPIEKEFSIFKNAIRRIKASSK